MSLHSNSDYKLIFEHAGYKFYAPVETTNYHKSRELAMNGQDMFSRAGIDAETLQQFAQLLLDKCNNTPAKDTLRSDVAVIATNILLRLREPVDELCAIRMGAIACFLEDEDPNKCTQAQIQQKMKIAQQHPEIFSFFLHLGIAFTPEYVNLLRGLEAEDYLQKRAEKLKLITPIT